MPKLHELREQRANRVAEMRSLVDAAETAKRDMSVEERSRFDSLKGEAAGLELRISQAETLADLERRFEAEPLTAHGGYAALEQRYSIGQAISDIISSGRLTGAEAEWSAEHRKSDRKGGGIAFAAPVSAFMASEHRAVLTTAPSAGPGGNLVSTQLGPLIDRPRPRLVVGALGATVLTGLTDNLDLPKLKSSGTVSWVGEHQNVSKSDPTFGKMSMGPKTAGGTYEMSRRMLIQAPQIEQILRNDIGLLLAGAIDQQAIRGTGTANNPRGVKFTPGVRKAPFDASQPPATPTALDKLFGAMQSVVDATDIEGNAGWLTSPQVISTVGRMRNSVDERITDFFAGLPVKTSTMVPANSGANTNLSEIYYSGNWADLVVGYWSSVDLLLNPYHPDVAMNGGALLHAFVDVDVGIRNPEAFSFCDTLPVASYTTTAVA